MVSSAVEHCLHTAGATGSIPVPPTNNQEVTERAGRRYETSIKLAAAALGKEKLARRSSSVRFRAHWTDVYRPGAAIRGSPVIFGTSRRYASGMRARTATMSASAQVTPFAVTTHLTSALRSPNSTTLARNSIALSIGTGLR